MNDDQSVKEQVEDHVQERITLSRGELWMLRIAAVTGVASLFAHGGQILLSIWDTIF